LASRYKLLLGIGIVVLVVLVIGGAFWGMYNSLITKSQAVEAQWAQVETQYQRRYDLIPNLVNAVKGYITQETKVLQMVTDARTKYGSAQTSDEKAVAAGELESVLSRLLVVMENYPNIRSVETVTNLMDELAGTENRISVERRGYNDKVRDYNTAIKTFPRNMFASLFGFEIREYFKSTSGTDQVPTVEF
jgi:LemA protein